MTKTKEASTIILYKLNPMGNDYTVIGIIKSINAQKIYDLAQIMLPNLPISRYVSLKLVNSFDYTRIGYRHRIKVWDGFMHYTFYIDYKFIGAMLKEPKYFKVSY